MTNKNHEEQLQPFFEHNPVDDDLSYLKHYVKEHPDNKMGWYLLGKEYASRGKEGKAAYCYAQAGEVFEAFEKQRLEPSPVENNRPEQTAPSRHNGRGRRFVRTARLAAALLAAALLGSFWPVGDGETDLHRTTGSSQETAATVFPQREMDELRMLYKNPLEPVKQEGELLKELLLPSERGGKLTLLVEGKLTTDGKWIDARQTPALLMSGRTEGSGELKVAYHKAEYCGCSAVQDQEAEAKVKAWAARQEEELVLRSAVQAYQERYGKDLPPSIDGLIRDFPHNLLPGYTELMKEKYAELAAAGADSASGVSTFSQAEAGMRPYGKPLEILVDKTTYRLALISGTAILRSYPVGLGGSRTPEGVFRITDKVKNPNGRSSGDFGSRGLQLSDTSYAIHGTNQPGSIGKDRSLGCIRMLKEDVEELFDMAPSGTKVTIGSGLLPPEIIRQDVPFRMPALREEQNPNKVYRWLN